MRSLKHGFVVCRLSSMSWYVLVICIIGVASQWDEDRVAQKVLTSALAQIQPTRDSSEAAAASCVSDTSRAGGWPSMDEFFGKQREKR